MVYTVDDYRDLLEISQTKNKLYNALYLIEDIGRNILELPYYTLEETTSQRDLFIKLLTDTIGLINNPNESLLKQAEQQDHTNIMFMKSADGVMHWIGSPTNKFEDKHRHILMEKAHIKYVDMLEKGEASYPPLLVWHKDEWKVGQTDWVAYDDRGFLVAGGTVEPEYEELMKELQKEPLGMSHRMPMKTLKFEPIVDVEKGEYLGIAEYISNEFTVLPLNEAANELTNWST